MQKLFACLFFIFIVHFSRAQHQTNIEATLIADQNMVKVKQDFVFVNETNDTLIKIIINDWNNAFSSNGSQLSKRFSDEFIRNFHLSRNKEKGFTTIISCIDDDNKSIFWQRKEKQLDIIELYLNKGLAPQKTISFTIEYTLKLPHNKFTKHGYDDTGFSIKNGFLEIAATSNNEFVSYSNLNLDDNFTPAKTINLRIKYPKKYSITTDLDVVTEENEEQWLISSFNANLKKDFALYIEENKSFLSYKNEFQDIACNINSNKVNDYQKAIIIDRISRFVKEEIGTYPFKKIVVSQQDYEKNPFYGLNQLPSFLSPFNNEFLFEIKFLKTYLNNYLKNSLQIDIRKDSWLLDAVQIYTLQKYIKEYHPDEKMMGNVSKLKILKGYTLFNLNFNDQFGYYSMLMARKNLDQPIGNAKDSFIKFNEQISGKYKAGLALHYLNSYLGDATVNESIKDFYNLSIQKFLQTEDFKNIITNKTTKNIDWFFENLIYSRNTIDYKITHLEKKKDTFAITIKNKTKSLVPISLYGFKDKKLVSKQWLEPFAKDTVIQFKKSDFDRFSLNEENEIPEFNQRNNYKSITNLPFKNRPLRVNIFRDIENPRRNQLLYVPTVEYNLYNGISLGLRFNNKTLLDKPFIFQINPEFATRVKALTGSFALEYFDFKRKSSNFLTRYSFTGIYSNYAPDARFLRLIPSVQFRFRPSDFRDNQRELLLVRHVFIDREPSVFTVDENTENYSVFNTRYVFNRNELIDFKNFIVDLQLANSFGKIATEVEYRHLFENNRQINFRFYAGKFLYRNTTSDFFSFGLDRPTDYLFDYNLLGRSEETGFFSQQFVMAEGGFKAKLPNRFINDWLTTLNTSFNIWNWVEVYGDLGVIKSRGNPAEMVFDSGIRLNLLTDYFEVYFPVYSSNGWEIQNNYSERIRFIITLNPSKLVTLFTRKWF